MARENTTCVNATDYEAPNFTAEIIALVASLIAAIPTLGISLVFAGAAAFSALRKVLEYMLHGKLVCLGGDRCAIGWIAELEPVGYQKPFPDNIDDDYSLNILLAPSSPHDFERDSSDANASMKANLAVAQAESVQGTLITEQPPKPPGMPKPREAEDGFGHYHGYYTWFDGPQIGTRIIVGDKQVHIPFTKSPKGPFPVPVLHAECEGSRSSTLLDVLNNVPPGLGGFCKIPLIGWLTCAIVSALAAPIVLIALGIAWAAAEGGDPADVGAGTIKVGDLVVLNGRWNWDAGHSGWNELHPLKTMQKIPDSSGGPWSDFQSFHKRWCERTSEAPPTPADPTAKPAGMTPTQETIWDSQQQPHNGWELHPDVDGCQPEREPGPVR